MSIERSLDAFLADFTEAPPRVVSLVPSYTQSLFDLGFGKYVMGITDYCIRPEGALEKVQRVGGVYDLHVDQIIALSPDLVIANQEENRPEAIHALSAAGLRVWLTFPKTVTEMFAVLVGMVELYHDPVAALKVRTLEAALDWAALSAQDQPSRSVFVPIWQETDARSGVWWMTFNQETYSSDLLDRLGYHNVFTRRFRRYPLDADLGRAEEEPAGERDVRYPRVTAEEVIAAQPDIILLPDEPFPFDDQALALIQNVLRDTPAVRAGRVYQIDGSLIAWYGTRIGTALEELTNLLAI